MSQLKYVEWDPSLPKTEAYNNRVLFFKKILRKIPKAMIYNTSKVLKGGICQINRSMQDAVISKYKALLVLVSEVLGYLLETENEIPDNSTNKGAAKEHMILKK